MGDDNNPAQIYFAYGSNMKLAQMVSRCPSAAFLRGGKLNNHSIDFSRFSEKWEGGVAGVKSQAGSSVEGLLYRLNGSDLIVLDNYEGVLTRHYFRKLVEIELQGENSDPILAWVYFPYEDKWYRPSNNYLNIMLEAAKKHEFSDEYVQKIEDAAIKSQV